MIQDQLSPIEAPENNFQCSKCSESFEYRSSLFIHELSHKKSTACCICGLKVFSDQLPEHVKTHIDFFCDYCGDSHTTKASLRKHIQDHAESCGLPQKPITFKTVVMVPTVSATSENYQDPVQESFSCDLCLDHFSDKMQLHVHMSDAHRDIFKCTKCSYQSRDLENYKIHTETHKKYRCNGCDKEFLYKRARREHVKNEHERAGKRDFACDACGKFFRTIAYVRRHKSLTHNSEKFKCAYCDRSFKTRAELNIHVGSLWKMQKCSSHIKEDKIEEKVS